MEIGNRIREARKEASLSIDDMADKVGLGYEAYRRIEKGNILVTTENLISISSILNVSTDFILYGSDEKICDMELAQIINNLSIDERIKARNVLMAVFPT